MVKYGRERWKRWGKEKRVICNKVSLLISQHITITWHTLYPAEPPGRHKHLTGLRDVCCHGNKANNNDVTYQQAYKGKKTKELEPHEKNSTNAIVDRLKSERRVLGRKSSHSSIIPHYSSKTEFVFFAAFPVNLVFVHFTKL